MRARITQTGPPAFAVPPVAWEPDRRLPPNEPMLLHRSLQTQKQGISSHPGALFVFCQAAERSPATRPPSRPSAEASRIGAPSGPDWSGW